MSFKFHRDVYIQPYPYRVEAFGWPWVKERRSRRRREFLTYSNISPPAGNSNVHPWPPAISIPLVMKGSVLETQLTPLLNILVADSFFLLDKIPSLLCGYLHHVSWINFYFFLEHLLSTRCLFPQISYVENSNSQCGGIWRRDLWEEINPLNPSDEISALLRGES